MPIRIASFNVENLFRRARVMNLATTAAARPILDDINALHDLLARTIYSDADKAAIKALLEKHNVEREELRPFFIQQVREKLYTLAKVQPAKMTLISRIKAGGRGDWDGWIELERELVSEKAIENTARVIETVNADVLCLVEAESRPALVEFDRRFLKSSRRYGRKMLIDGNDPRGIDVSLLSRFEIREMRSHVDDALPHSVAEPERLSQAHFARDCAEYEVRLPGGKSLWVLCNHFKSRGYGSKAGNDLKRVREALRVKQILQRFDLATQFVAVCGDLNELPGSASLAPLLTGTPKLRNVFDKLPAGALRWTHRDDAVPSQNDQIDYLLVSEALFAKCEKVEIERRGIFRPGKPASERFDTVTSNTTAASDHAAVWAEFDL